MEQAELGEVRVRVWSWGVGAVGGLHTWGPPGWLPPRCLPARTLEGERRAWMGSPDTLWAPS